MCPVAYRGIMQDGGSIVKVYVNNVYTVNLRKRRDAGLFSHKKLQNRKRKVCQSLQKTPPTDYMESPKPIGKTNAENYSNLIYH